MQKITSLYKHAAFYTFANTIEALTPLVMIPVLTRYLDKSEYGLWAIFQAVVTFLIPAIGLSFRDAIRMRYLQLSLAEFSKYINSATVIISYLATIAFLTVILFNEPLTALIEINLVGLLAMVAMSVLYIFFYMTLAICQFADERAVFAKLQAVQTVISIGAMLLFVMNDYGWKGCAFGKLAGLSVVMVFAALFLYRRFRWCHPFRIDAAYKRELILFAAKYLPVGFFLVVIPLTNRLILSNTAGVEQTSLYAVSESFAMGLSLLTIGFMYAWQPWMFRKMQEADYRTARKSVILCTIGYIAALPFAGFILAVISWWVIPFLLGAQFQDVRNFILGNMMLISGLGAFQIMQSFLHYKKKIGWMSFCSLLVIFLNFFSSLTISKYASPVYVAYGTAACYFLSALVTLVIVMRVYDSK